MKKYKVIILDLDGTTVPSKADGVASKKVIDAVRKAHKKIKISVASGRPYFLAKDILKALNIDGPCVLDGGAQIMDVKSGKILFERFLSIAQQKEILKLVLPYGYEIYKSQEGRRAMKSIFDANEETGKLVILGATPKDTIKMLEELAAVEGAAAHPVHNAWINPNYIDIHITNANSTKKHAIQELLQILKVKKNQAIGIGDSLNDLPLFESVGFKVAMGNAPKELKELADYIAPTIDEDGVVDVIERFVL